jgi:ppGpp synthetase/RelA/SpoT-type nucleotidyltranferase
VPDFIEKNIDVFERVVKIYEDEVKDILDHEAKELVKRIKKVIDQHSSNYNLETQNDVNPIKYYSLKYRIKGAVSLKEKLVRKNEGFKIIEIGEINEPAEVQTKKASVVSQLKRMPDIIGVRIVTELRYDCSKVLALLRAFVDNLAASEVVLDKIDLEAQPQKMKNGLFIYKIKGIFRADFGFELQIKSKIEEAWGDMDHAIFYKDYSVTPIKNVTQVTMNNVGKLLENIDELLLGLRNSGSQYQENLEQLANLKSLNDELYPLIEQKLGISFEIGKVASFLYSVKEKAFAGIENPQSITNLDCSFFAFDVTDERLQRYVKIREQSFELMIIEAAYFNWSTLNGKLILVS